MYEPSTANVEQPKDLPGLLRWTASFTRWVLGEFKKVADAMAGARTELVFKPLAEDPKRVYAHMYVHFLAAASSAHSGAGLYRRNAANTAWDFVG